MVVPAPGLFSITKVWCSDLRNSSAMARVYTSVGPPAPNGTMILTERDGYSSALLGGAPILRPAASASRTAKCRIVVMRVVPVFARRVARANYRGPIAALSIASIRGYAHKKGGKPCMFRNVVLPLFVHCAKPQPLPSLRLFQTRQG